MRAWSTRSVPRPNRSYPSTSPGGTANAAADKAVVAQVLADSFEVLPAGDTARLERVIHPEAALRAFRASPPTGRFFLLEANRDAMLATARANTASLPANPAVTILDVCDTIASALTTTETG